MGISKSYSVVAEQPFLRLGMIVEEGYPFAIGDIEPLRLMTCERDADDHRQQSALSARITHDVGEGDNDIPRLDIHPRDVAQRDVAIGRSPQPSMFRLPLCVEGGDILQVEESGQFYVSIGAGGIDRDGKESGLLKWHDPSIADRLFHLC